MSSTRRQATTFGAEVLTAREVVGLPFEKLDDDKIAWLSERGRAEQRRAGTRSTPTGSRPPASSCCSRAPSR